MKNQIVVLPVLDMIAKRMELFASKQHKIECIVSSLKSRIKLRHIKITKGVLHASEYESVLTSNI